MTHPRDAAEHVPLSDLLAVFGRIGLLSFGGPAAQIGLMHRELVETRPWLDEASYLRALSFCMLLPGPEAMQLATYCGWRLRGVAGGLLAGLLFVLPGALVILALAFAYARLADLAWVQALFLGVKAVVVVIVLDAVVKLSRRALGTRLAWGIAIGSFVSLYALHLPYPLIIAAAALTGFARPPTALAQWTEQPPKILQIPIRLTLQTVALWGTLWLIPLAGLMLFAPSFFGPMAVFFSKLAVVSFGGAYALLAYMTQTVVTDYGWITTDQMMDALGLADTTPGPLILVTEFVAVLAGYGQGGPVVGVSAGLVALWMTFVPCFLWVFAGAPYIDALATRPRLQGALDGITAAVVGVIVHLSLWFALHVLFMEQITLGGLLLPVPGSVAPLPVLLSALAGAMIFWRGIGLVPTLATAALVSLALHPLSGLG